MGPVGCFGQIKNIKQQSLNNTDFKELLFYGIHARCNFHIINELLELDMDKNLVFEYIVYRLDGWKRKIGAKQIPAFTKLRLQKILFLICAWNVSKEEPKLLNVFNHFCALPYGPVEMDIYEAMKDTTAFKHLHFEENECVYDAMNNSMFEELSKATKDYVDEAVEHFISDKRDYLTMPVFDLVDITHKWSVWQISMEYAKLQGRNKEGISNESIINSSKYYG